MKNSQQQKWSEQFMKSRVILFLFCVQSRDKVLSEHEKLSQKSNLLKTSSQFLFVVASTLRKSFFNEGVLSWLSYSSDPIDGSETKTIVNMEID